MTPAEIERFLAVPRVARLATSEPDGFIRLTPVWFHYEGGRFQFALGEARRHLRNLRRDHRATLLVDVDERPEVGERGAVVAVMCRGRCEICEEPARVAEVSARIDRSYLGTTGEPDEEVAASAESYVLVTLTPVKLVTWDFSK
jgi:PPOX class probable F420-dependent enzyme